MSGGTHLRLEERERLAALKGEGLSLRAIARQLGRAASTISRELRRNALPKGGYLPAHAEGCYLERRQRPALVERDAKLGRFVRERLLEGWTPEQIAGWLKRGEERGLGTVSTETIYAFVHRPGQKGEKLWKLLPRGRARRGRRRARQPRSVIAERRSIHDRPEVVQERKEAGHWEGDLLICRRTRPVLVLKERKTRFVLAARLAGKSAAETVAIMMAVFRRLDPRLRASITFDNDTAFRNGPLGVKPLEQVSRRRVHASVRGRHDGRHTMPSGEEPTSQSLAAWFRPEGSDHLRCPGFVGSRVPATGPRGSRTVRSRSEAARFAPDDYASAASLPKRNSLPSTHRRCRRAESLRARATLARFMPRRLATSSAQRFRVENRPVLVSIACAAS